VKQTPSAHRSTPAAREARVAAVVANAKARGEKVPRGVKLIGFQDIPAAAHAHAARLVPLARKAFSRAKTPA